jgi:hypothetical protein
VAKKLSRFHEQVYFPSWADSSIKKFLEGLNSRSSVLFTLHSVERVALYNKRYGRKLLKFLAKSVKRGSFKSSQIFEFYSKNETIKKACFRLSFDGFPVDLVLVISADATIITIFPVNKDDFHDSLDLELYEKGV